MNIDLTPLWQAAIAIAATVITIFGGMALKKLESYLGLKADDELRKSLDDALDKGINYAVEMAKQQSQNLSSVVVRNDIAATAADYIVPKIPDLLEKLGLDAEGVRQRLVARFEDPASAIPTLPGSNRVTDPPAPVAAAPPGVLGSASPVAHVPSQPAP